MVTKPGVVAPAQHIRNAWEDNADGAGYAYVDVEKKELVIKKGWTDCEDFIRAYHEDMTNNPLSNGLCHLRWASAGDVNSENCHPFELNTINGNTALIHNGTIHKMNAKKDGDSDTKMFAKYLDELPDDFIYSEGTLKLLDKFIGQSKVVLLDEENTITFINESLGEWVEDIWYSNDYWKPETYRCDTTNRMKYKSKSEEKSQGAGTTVGTTGSCKTCGKPLQWVDEFIAGNCWRCMDEEEFNKALGFEEYDECLSCGIKLENEIEKEEGLCDNCALAEALESKGNY